MKKYLIIVCFLLLLSGCGKKEDTHEEEHVDTFVVSKNDISKDYVYSSLLSTFILPDNSTYEMEEIVVNLNSEDASNVNMELRSFINQSNIYVDGSNNQFVNGYVYSYEHYVTKDYLSLVIPYQYITNGIYGDEDCLVYVLSLDNGKIISNEELLKVYNLTEDDLFSKVESIKSEDALFSVRSMKENGYYLYVNRSSQLVVLFYEITDEESVKKELVIS